MINLSSVFERKYHTFSRSTTHLLWEAAAAPPPYSVPADLWGRHFVLDHCCWVTDFKWRTLKLLLELAVGMDCNHLVIHNWSALILGVFIDLLEGCVCVCVCESEYPIPTNLGSLDLTWVMNIQTEILEPFSFPEAPLLHYEIWMRGRKQLFSCFYDVAACKCLTTVLPHCSYLFYQQISLLFMFLHVVSNFLEILCLSLLNALKHIPLLFLYGKNVHFTHLLRCFLHSLDIEFSCCSYMYKYCLYGCLHLSNSPYSNK